MAWVGRSQACYGAEFCYDGFEFGGRIGCSGDAVAVVCTGHVTDGCGFFGSFVSFGSECCSEFWCEFRGRYECEFSCESSSCQPSCCESSSCESAEQCAGADAGSYGCGSSSGQSDYNEFDCSFRGHGRFWGWGRHGSGLRFCSRWGCGHCSARQCAGEGCAEAASGSGAGKS